MQRKGNQTYIFDNPPYIIGAYSVVGPKEAEGNFGDYYDLRLENDTFEEKSYEKAECKMHKTAMENAVNKAGLTFKDIDTIISGDISNQITASSFSARGHDAMYLGLYSACATFGEAALVGSMLICGGFMDKLLCSTSSHFSSAERQYRYPLELGNQRPPAAQWTVTGAGAVVIAKTGKSGAPRITGGTVGKITDLGITDVNNMGAAMAPAACECLYTHFKESGREPSYYDLILTGDLGKYGRDMTRYLLKEKGLDLPETFNDCGAMIFKDEQETFQGGSGAGCSSSVFASFIYKQMSSGHLNKVLLVPTGALLSKTSSEQGESIPGIAHAISIEVL
ncbi:MAG: stage V sporulation protein AD [Clostridiales bacterium]|jgi:stage V sporulation protein AD|nr:stage V sporulation protein AD [Clostridiales bacterium]